MSDNQHIELPSLSKSKWNSSSRSSSKDDILRRRIEHRVNGILKSVKDPFKERLKKQRKTDPGINLPKIKLRTKSKRKHKGKQSKHIASLDTVEKIIKKHKERKDAVSMSIETPKLLPRLTSIPEDEISAFHLIDRSMKEANYGNINKDVITFSKNSELLRQILVNTVIHKKTPSSLLIENNQKPRSCSVRRGETSNTLKDVSVELKKPEERLHRIPKLKYHDESIILGPRTKKINETYKIKVKKFDCFNSTVTLCLINSVWYSIK